MNANTQRRLPANAWILSVLLLCLVLRLAVVVRTGEVRLVADAVSYSGLAKSLEAGHGFLQQGHVTACRDPLYPAFVAASYFLFGNYTTIPIRILQCLIDTLTCYLLFLSALRLGLGRRAGLIACVMFAVCPWFITSANSILTETLATFLAVLLVYAACRALENESFAWIWPGIVCGFAILNKGSLLLFPLALVIVFWLSRHRVDHAFAKVAVFCVAAAVVVAPWTVRNYIVLGGFAPTNTYGWSTIWAGTGIADGQTIGWWSDRVVSKDSEDAKSGRWVVVSESTRDKINRQRDPVFKMSETNREAHMRKMAIQQILADPVTFVYLGVKKFFRLWFNLWYDRPPSRTSIAIAVVNSVLVLLAVGGYRRWGKNQTGKHILLAYILTTTLSSVVALSVIRQSFPAVPFLLLFASVQLARYSRSVIHSREASNCTMISV